MNLDQTYERIWRHFNTSAPFTKEEFDMIGALSKPYELKKGALVVKQQTIPKYGGYIVTGSLRHFQVDPFTKRETTFDFTFEDHCFGDLRSILYMEPAQISVEALEDCFIYRLDKEHYLQLFETCKPFARMMLLHVEKRVNDLVLHAIHRQNCDADRRYVEMLEKYPHILQRVPQRYIASYLGIKPQSLSRIRKQIADKLHLASKAA